ncbi:MAG: recombinase RecA [Deltaproteobacteria bacterium]|nr:recombinase RecA [Deltaproteobacteria bacterium]
MSLIEKIKGLRQTITAIEKQFGKGSLMVLGEREIEDVPSISTSCPSLDHALGVGGFPRGRISEIFGPEASGKTTLTLHAIAECQRAGGIAAFIDAEHALDTQYAKQIGVDVDALLVSQPDCGEQALDIVEALVRSGSVDLIVIDSVAALVPRAEIEGEMGDAHVGLQARLMSQALRKLAGITYRSKTAIIFINQLRMKIGVTFGSPETTTGGQALKFFTSVRIDIRRIGPVKAGEEVVGSRTRAKVVKNKLAPPFQSVEFDIRYGVGIDALGDLIDSAIQANALSKHGAYYAFDEVNIGQGRERTREALKADAELCRRIAERTWSIKSNERKGSNATKTDQAA